MGRRPPRPRAINARTAWGCSLQPRRVFGGRVPVSRETAGCVAARCWVPAACCSGQFARVVKGVDLRSTAGNCAWARAPQLTASSVPGASVRIPEHSAQCAVTCRAHSRSRHCPCWCGPAVAAAVAHRCMRGLRPQAATSPCLRRPRACLSCSSQPPISRGQFARVVKGVDLRSTTGNCAWVRTP